MSQSSNQSSGIILFPERSPVNDSINYHYTLFSQDGNIQKLSEKSITLKSSQVTLEEAKGEFMEWFTSGWKNELEGLSLGARARQSKKSMKEREKQEKEEREKEQKTVGVLLEVIARKVGKGRGTEMRAAEDVPKRSIEDNTPHKPQKTHPSTRVRRKAKKSEACVGVSKVSKGSAKKK